jgi:hypothetical protein
MDELTGKAKAALISEAYRVEIDYVVGQSSYNDNI